MSFANSVVSASHVLHAMPSLDTEAHDACGHQETKDNSRFQIALREVVLLETAWPVGRKPRRTVSADVLAAVHDAPIIFKQLSLLLAAPRHHVAGLEADWAACSDSRCSESEQKETHCRACKRVKPAHTWTPSDFAWSWITRAFSHAQLGKVG